MIPGQWYVVLESKQVKRDPVGIMRMGEQLVFWRDETGKVTCLQDRCVHRGAALSRGEVLHGPIDCPEEDLPHARLRCPFHGFEYDPFGRVTRIPAEGKQRPVAERFRVKRYPTHEAHGFIWIWWGDEPPAELAPPRFFDDIDAGFRYATLYDPWDTHYSRVIENQLDVVHLPFVHHNTIGRGCKTLVNGPGVQWIGDDMFYVFVYNQRDDGQTTPKRLNEVLVPDPERDYRLKFIFPNLWENRISEKVRVVAAFVPVDETHTLLYLRFYQKFLPLPLVGDMVARLVMPFNRLVAHQDRRVVETQRPQRSQLRGAEQLIQGDRPIVEYRRRRAELLAEAKT
ncbi:MAG: Rieske 2Fe-2S domain-containing protein [Anaerolineae bacterium]